MRRGSVVAIFLLLSVGCSSCWHFFSLWQVRRLLRCVSTKQACLSKTYPYDSRRDQGTPVPTQSVAACEVRNRLRILCRDSSRSSRGREQSERDRRRGEVGWHKPTKELCTYMNRGSIQVERITNQRLGRRSVVPLRDLLRISKTHKPGIESNVSVGIAEQTIER
jgi:hypothetical protein